MFVIVQRGKTLTSSVGEPGIQRMAWDVLAQPGATDLILHRGLARLCQKL